MDILERYKQLSKEDKNNLSIYCIYKSIYSIAANENYSISDDEVKRIKDLSYYIYLKDEYYNLAPDRISDYITEKYIRQNISLNKIEEMPWSELIEAIDNNSDLSNEEKIER